jgi:hypothetical protein
MAAQDGGADAMPAVFSTLSFAVFANAGSIAKRYEEV